MTAAPTSHIGDSHDRGANRRGALLTGAVCALALAGLAGWQVLADDTTEPAPTEPAPTEPAPTADTVVDDWQTDPVFDAGPDAGPDNGFELLVEAPRTDVSSLAEIHATSRLQYDECQQDYADVAADPSSSRNPMYFC